MGQSELNLEVRFTRSASRRMVTRKMRVSSAMFVPTTALTCESGPLA